VESYSLFRDLWTYESVHYLSLDYSITSALHTLYLAAFSILRNFTSQVFRPTVYTESVLTSHSHRLRIHLFPWEITTADWTLERTTRQSGDRGLASLDGSG
jgi:hypothetical protein